MRRQGAANGVARAAAGVEFTFQVCVNEVPSITVSPGTRVGEFLLDEKIGQGTFGEVWKAHHKAWTSELAAVKIPTDAAYVRHLQSEGFNLHRLSHPNVVRVIGFDPTGSPPYLISELVDGPSLRQLMSRGRLPLPHAVAIMRQILAGLAYAHGQGVLHGDLKPGNVLTAKTAEASGFETEGSVKLADFAVGTISAAMLAAAGSSGLFRGERSGAIGTLAYMAPEQRDSATLDARSDLFACGVILFELLTGERPAGAESPSDLNPQVPPALDDVFRRAYARRDRRYASAGEFLAALNAAYKPGTTAAVAEEPVIAMKADEPEPAAPISHPPPPAPAAPPPPPQPAPPPPQPTPPAAGAGHPEPQPPRPTAKPQPRGIIVIDEMARKPLRTADDLRHLFRRVYLTRDLSQAEVANLSLRLDQWAESAGGLPGYAEKIEVVEALDCPYYRLLIRTDYEQDEGATETPFNEGAVMLANPSASQDCGQALTPSDFSLLLHISSGAFPPIVVDLIDVGVIRLAVANLLTAAKAQAHGRQIARQEFKLMRANVLSMRYTFEQADHGVCFAGNALKVIAPLTPVTRMRDDLLKRAAALLDSENVGAGINELRQMFETSNAAQPRAERMLVALRAKLSAAYMALAAATIGGMAVFESLNYSDRAAELQPSNRLVRGHERRVRRMAFWVHAGPGMVIGIVYALIAAFNQPLHIGYVAGSIGAIFAGLLTWAALRVRTARTDVAFCHACVVALAVSGILATFVIDNGSPRQRIYSYVATAILLGMVAFLERWIFNNYGYWLLRPQYRPNILGTPLDVLNQVQTMIEPDWESLKEHYIQLEPLYKHAAAKLASDESDAEAPGERSEEAPNPE